MKLAVRLDKIKRTPLRIIELTLSALSMIGGAYVMSPLLNYSTVTNGAGALAQTIAHPVGILIFGAVFFVSGAILAVGLVRDKKQWRAVGLIATIFCRTYSLIGAWITIGFLPLTWLSNFGLICISIIIYLAIKREQKKRGPTA